jgi:catechol 2,3-dioxygenase-like lactoylglutathione lyase family enzyme
MQPRMTHICLHVDNLQACSRFYRSYCGFEVATDRSVDGEGSVYLRAPGKSAEPVLQLKSGGKPRRADKSDDSHFGFAVDSRDRVDEIAEKGRKEGILFFEADEYLPGAYFCVLLDPNGNCVEFGYNHPVPPE